MPTSDANRRLPIARSTFLAGATALATVPSRVRARDLGDEPQIVFAPLGRQREIVTPPEDFFVRNHAGVPTIDPLRHRLLIDGVGLSVTREKAVTIGHLYVRERDGIEHGIGTEETVLR